MLATWIPSTTHAVVTWATQPGYPRLVGAAMLLVMLWIGASQYLSFRSFGIMRFSWRWGSLSLPVLAEYGSSRLARRRISRGRFGMACGCLFVTTWARSPSAR